MPLPPNNRGRGWLRLGVAILSLGLPFLSSAQMMNPTKPPAMKKPVTIEGTAMWYHVPPNSLAKRRAGKDELTVKVRILLPLSPSEIDGLSIESIALSSFVIVP